MPANFYDDWALLIFRKTQHDMWVNYLSNFGKSWNGRMGVKVQSPVSVSGTKWLPGTKRNPFRNELPPPLQ
jgi:hypothetical protein